MVLTLFYYLYGTKNNEIIGGDDSNILAVEDCPSLTVIVTNLTGDYGIEVRHPLAIVTAVYSLVVFHS